MNETERYGFDPICNECGKDLKFNFEHNCPKCHTPYCSKECQSKEKVCVPLTHQMIIHTVKQFGFKSEKEIPCEFRGCKYLPLPGPIEIGKIPKTLWSCRIGQARQLKEKIGGTDDCYYFVSLPDAYKLFERQLTEQQKGELNLLGDVAGLIRVIQITRESIRKSTVKSEDYELKIISLQSRLKTAKKQLKELKRKI